MGNKIQVIEFDDKNYTNYLTFLTPLFQYEMFGTKYDITYRRDDKGKSWGSFVDGKIYFKHT